MEVNDSFMAVSGYPREELVGRRLPKLNLALDPEQMVQIVYQLQSKKIIENQELRWNSKSGETQTS